ncbi:ROK family protein [Companilactobacillus huachuanensis]|uniref:ROK family protein n=1 Tax=Companilactobacillus huachuanensis TaxID=2559914 RepID=A0ABW1RNQ2_9LACO|nr:ROK family protein [Companilactobacillus huachuanensis]
MTKTILSVDLGGTKILVGEVDRHGVIHSSRRYHSDVSTQRIAVNQIKSDISDYLLNINSSSSIQAITVDVVGRVNSKAGVWEEIDPTNINPINLASEISKTFNLPCFITNDLTAATVAENLFGIGNVTKNFIYLSIGTGLAGRVVINNEIIVGPDYDAGEFGHVVIDQNSPDRCECGRYGCIEPLASGLGMSNRTHLLYKDFQGQTKITVTPQKRIDARILFDAYDHNDPLAVAVVESSLRATANLIMNLTRMLNTKAFRLGGGVVTNGWYTDHLQKYLDQQTMRFVTYGVKNTDLDPNTIALIGCALTGFAKLDLNIHQQQGFEIKAN